MTIDWTLFFSAVGLAFVFEALPWLLAPDRMRETLLRIAQSPVDDLRKWGALLLGLGLVIVWAARV